jgi:putative acetyltransferase
MNDIEYRPFASPDAPGVASVVAAAFGGDDEVTLIETLRRDGDMVCEFVAATPSQIVGHIAFSRLQMRRGEATLRATALAPLAIAPTCQRSGVGQALTRFALGELGAMREDVVVVLGHPNYYRRFGFSSLVAKLLQAPYAGGAFMALELTPRALGNMRWNVTYARAFYGASSGDTNSPSG